MLFVIKRLYLYKLYLLLFLGFKAAQSIIGGGIPREPFQEVLNMKECDTRAGFKHTAVSASVLKLTTFTKAPPPIFAPVEYRMVVRHVHTLRNC